MAEFNVSPYAITYEQIRDNLRLMIASNSNTFTDFFNDGSGSSVVDLAAALGAFFAFHVIMQRKEFTLEQATSYKSLIGNAYDKGYNVSRGKNLRIKLTCTPKSTGSKQAWSNLGQYADYNVTLTKPIAYTLGIPVELEVIVGNRASESILADTNNIQLFRFVSDDVTDDVRLFLNDTEIIDYSTDIKDLLNDKYIMLSNSYGSVNVFYLQQGDKKYKIGDYITLDYIVRNNIDFTSISKESFYLPDFEITDIAVSEERESIENQDDIRVNAALHAETEGIIRSRADFSKVLREFEPSIVSISDEDIQPGRIGIYILKDDMEPLNQEDIKKYEKTVEARTVSGVANVIYENAAKYKTDLKVTLTTSGTVGISQGLLDNIITDLLKYQYNLDSLINFDDIEKYIEQQEGIKVARITVPTSAWQKRTYRVSDTCISSNFNDKAYYVVGFNFTTGGTMPNWSSKTTEGYVIDNHILWKEFVGNPTGIMVWQPHVPVKIGRLVVDSLTPNAKVYECVGFVAKSGTVTPRWSEVTDYVIDNNIVWEKVNPTSDYKQYGNQKLFRIGESIRINIGTAEKPDYIYFRMIDYAMQTGQAEPDWNGLRTSDGYVEDGDVLLWAETSYPVRFIQTAKNAYAEFNSKIGAV